MKLTPQATIFSGFGLTLVFMAGLVYFSYRNTEELVQQGTAVERAQEVLTQLELLMSLMTDVETGQRGFTLTGDEAFLEPYHMAVQRLEHEIRRLRDEITDPAQQHRLESLVPLLAERLEFARQVVELRRNQGFDAARERIARGEGKRIHDRIRTAVAEMKTSERSILSQREERTQRAFSYTQTFIVGGGVLTLLIVGFALTFSTHELAERSRAEGKLVAAYAWLRAMLESSDTAVIASDQHAVINTFNPAAERMLGYRAEEMIGKTPTVLHDDDEIRDRSAELSRELGREIQPGVEVFLSKAREGEPESREWTYIRKDGSRFPVSLTVTKMTDVAGHTIGYMGLANDITERRKAERALRESEERFRDLFENSTDMINAVSPDGAILYANRAWREKLGYSESEVAGLSAKDIIAPSHWDHYLAQARRVLAGEEIGTGEIVIQTKFGQELIVEGSTTSRFVDGQPESVRMIFRDITGRKQAEQALEQLTERLQMLLESTGEGIYGIDLEGRFTFINRSAASMLGFEREELLGRNAHKAIHHSRKDGSVYPAQDCPIFRTFRSGMGCIEDGEVLWRKDGTSFPAEYLSHPILRAGLPQGAVVAFNDITERKRAEVQLRARNEELKSFAYTISHDLKAPLRGISGYAQELDRRHKAGLGERAQFCITQIITAAKNLDCLIEDLLKYSRLDAETPTPTDLFLPDLVQSILRDRSHTLTELGVDVQVAVPPLKLHAWERGLRQVLSNLIDNAIKYSRGSQPPRLEISAAVLPAHCRISVSDNGIGFDMAYHERIFGLFNRLVLANEFEGTGAGLAIVKKLVEKLGGTIRAESVPGKGATFFVELPASPVTEAST